MSETVSIYESIGRNLGDIFAKGVATNGTGTTFESRVLVNPNARQLVGKEVFWYSGGGAGQARLVASFDPANNRIIHEQEYSTIPTEGSAFIVLNNFRSEDYESAMNRAIGKARSVHYDSYVATIAITATQYEYLVASGMEYIESIKFVPSSGSDYQNIEDIAHIFELPPRDWSITGNQGGSRIIAIDPRKANLDGFDNQICRVEGQCKPDFTGTTVSEELQEFVIQFSSMLLASQKDGNEWARRYYTFRDEVKGRGNEAGLEALIFSHPRGRKVNG